MMNSRRFIRCYMKCFRVGVQEIRFQPRICRIGQKVLRCNSDVSLGSIRSPVASQIRQATTGEIRFNHVEAIRGFRDARIRGDEFNKFQRTASILA
jgi:hypothetical protein